MAVVDKLEVLLLIAQAIQDLCVGFGTFVEKYHILS